MTVGYMEILGSDGEKFPNPSLGLTRQSRDALARYCELRWPTGRRKSVAVEWNLTPDEARSVCEATASASTIDKVWKHPNGGWNVALVVLAAVIGHGLEDAITNEKKRHEELARRHGALARDLRAGLGLRDRLRPELGSRPNGERRSFSGRVVIRKNRQAEGE